MVNLRTIGEKPTPKQKTPRWANQQGGHSCNFANHWGETGGLGMDIGFTPAGLGPMVASFSAFVNPFFYFFSILSYLWGKQGLTPVPKPLIIQGYATCSRENTMFEAAILICLAAAPQECVELNDTRGPYASKADCMRRVDEMAGFATSVNLFELNIKWKCTALKGVPS